MPAVDAALAAPEVVTADDSEPGISAIGRRARHAFTLQALGACIAYAVQVLLARLLGAGGFGLYSYTVVWAGFASRVASFGLPDASVRLVPQYRITNDLARLHSFVRTSRMLAISAAVVGVSLGAVLAAAEGIHGPTSWIFIAALTPALAASALEGQLARAAGRVGIALAPPLVVRPLLIAVGVSTLFAVNPTAGAAMALTVTTGVTYGMVFVQYLLGRKLVESRTARPATQAELRSWLALALPLMAAGTFSVVLLQVDIVLVGALQGTAEAGIYTAASKTASLVSFVLMAVNVAAAPRFSSLHAQGRLDELQTLVARLAHWTFWPSLGLALCLGVLAGPLMALFGPTFDAARVPLLVLLVGQIVNAAFGPVGYLLTMTGHHRDAARVLGASVAFGVSLVVVGIAVLGILGAAIGSAVAFGVWNGWLYWLAVTRLGIRPSIVDALSADDRPDRSTSA